MSHNPENDANDPMETWMRRQSNDPPERSHRPLPETMARILVVFAAYWLGSALATAVAVPELKFLNPTLLGLAVSVLLAAVTMLAFPIWSED